MTRPRQDSAAGRQLKILMLLLYYHPHPTGLTYYVKTLAEGLAARGHQVTVLAAHHSGETMRGESVENGVRVIRLWAPISISRGMIMPAYPLRLISLLRQHDVLNIHLPMLESGLAAWLARAFGKPVVATHHADLVLPRSLINNLITDVMARIYRFTVRRAACVVAYSQDNSRHSAFLRPFQDKVRAIYPPAVIPEPQPARVRELQAAWRQEGGPLIGFAGRFAEEKRPDLLIRALEIVNAQYANARIVFAGETEIPYENTWQRFGDLVRGYQRQLIFLGLLTDKQALANFYAACDLLVLPSDIEVFALVQAEAMLCGTPVVATDVHGGRVPVSVTGMGKLARKGDWRSIGAAIVDVLDAPRQFIKTREDIARIFSYQHTVAEYEALFLEQARE